MNYQLPGGAWIEGHLVQTAALRPLSGRLELELREQFARAPSWPKAVSGVLALAVERVGDRPCSLQIVEDLSVADRQFLLLSLTVLLHGDEFWVSAHCRHCAGRFDLGLRRSQLPVKPAGAGYPFADLDCAGQTLRLRVPSGADQQRLVPIPEPAAIRVLAQCCLVEVDGLEPARDFTERLSDEDLACIEAALDELAPDIGTRVQTRCPECSHEQRVELDPYAGAQWRSGELYSEIHIIAARYHWSEAEILALPRARRRLYLGLIEQERGLYH